MICAEKKNGHIAIVLPDLRGGGVERMRIALAHEWLRSGYQVEFVVLRQRGELVDLIPENATIVDLNCKRFRDAFVRLTAYFNRSKPTVVLAAMWPLTAIVVMASLVSQCGARRVISDHNILSESYKHARQSTRFLMHITMATCYRLAHERIAVSRGVAENVSMLSGIRRDRFRVINNPASTTNYKIRGNTIAHVRLPVVKGRLILSVGTLKPMKGHAHLIAAFAVLVKDCEATLCILGDGALRNELEEIVVELGLQGRVLLPGFQLDPKPWYQRADLFVLASHYEGFGNVIVEALEHGVPVVSTDCSGPREILRDGQFGLIVPVGDTAALANAMHSALSSSPCREALKARARDFSADTVAAEYVKSMFPTHRC